jgi:SSS family solute:Na+ symporter
LAAKNETQARRGTILASYLKLFPIFIFFIPGVTAYALAKTGQLNLPAADQAFPAMVKLLLPAGIRGLVVGGLLAALMSSLAAVFNSCSTLFTMDIYKKLKPHASEKTLVQVGRIATGVVVVCGILWIPLMKFISSELYHYLQSVQAYFAPPIFSVFLLGLFWKRINSQGALTALVGGFIIGMLRLAAEIFKDKLSGWLYTFADVNFLYFCVYLTLFCIGMMIVVSMLTRAPNIEKIQGLTYATTVAEDKKASRASWNRRDVILSLIVLIIIALVMVLFSPLVLAK